MEEYLDAVAAFWRGVVAAAENAGSMPAPPDPEKGRRLEKTLRRA